MLSPFYLNQHFMLKMLLEMMQG